MIFQLSYTEKAILKAYAEQETRTQTEILRECVRKLRTKLSKDFVPVTKRHFAPELDMQSNNVEILPIEPYGGDDLASDEDEVQLSVEI